MIFGRRVWRDLPVILRRLCLREQHLYNSNQQIMLYAELEQPGIIFDHNLFYHDGASSSQYFEWNGNVYAGLAEFQSGSGTNTHSCLLTLYISHQILLPPTSILEGSAAYNKGNPETITDVLETDLDDQPRVLNDTIDCGAYEYYSEPVGIADLQNSILIYPNPAHQFIHLEAHSYISAGCMMSLERSSASGSRYLNKYQQTNSFQDTICWCWTMAFNGIRFQL